MANKVSFIIELKDKYSAAARQINTANDKMARGLSTVKAKVDKLYRIGRDATKTGAIMTAAITVPIALMAKKMVDSASNAEETSDKFKAVFSGVAVEADKAADKFAKTFFLARSSADEMLGSTGDLVVGFGFMDKEALALSQTVGKLALDLGAFQNKEPAEVVQSLTNALSGEAEALKSLGIVINQNNPAFKKALKLNTAAAEGDIVRGKALTILAESFRQTAKAQDNYLTTIDTFAGQQRVAAEATKELNESFGKLLLPTAVKIAKKITSISNSMEGMSEGTKKVILFAGLFLAIAGPLLVIVGLLAIAFSAVSAPVIIIGALIAGAVAGIMLFSDEISAALSLIKELWFQTSLGKIAGLAIDLFSSAPPSTPVNNGSASLNGEISVSATPGTTINSTSLKGQSSGLNMGVNMVAANGG